VHTVGLVLPTAWDRRQLAACRDDLAGRFAIVEIGPDDADVGADFDVDGFVRGAKAEHRGRLDGLFSSSDYPGAQLAAVLAQELGLPGPGPRAVLAASHKLASRRLQQAAVPAAVPAFAPVDPAAPAPWPWAGPAFCKPAKGTFSMHSARVDDLAALRAHLSRPAIARYRAGWLLPWRRLLARWAPDLPPADHFLVEQLLGGQLVTVEGLCQRDEVAVLGVVDSRVHERHGSFLQFDYPSRLPAAAQRECERVAAAVARAHGLRDTFFNVELFWDAERGRAVVVELNPRLCGQFADLHQKVDGVHTYALACALACGLQAPVRRGAGAFAAAASVPLRVFAPCRVERAPDAAAIAAVEAAAPGLHAWSECATGDELWDFAGEDGVSIRYAVLNLGGTDREQIAAQGRELAERLGWVFAPLPRC
jgi:hypothetical protein